LVCFLSGIEVCDKFIYPILDWEDHPGMAVGVIFGGCLFIPLIHCFWVGLAQLRMAVYKWTVPAQTRFEGGREIRPLQTTEI
jgi:hypothetical protein